MATCHSAEMTNIYRVLIGPRKNYQDKYAFLVLQLLICRYLSVFNLLSAGKEVVLRQILRSIARLKNPNAIFFRARQKRKVLNFYGQHDLFPGLARDQNCQDISRDSDSFIVCENIEKERWGPTGKIIRISLSGMTNEKPYSLRGV